MVFLQYDPALAPGDRERLEQLGQGVDDASSRRSVQGLRLSTTDALDADVGSAASTGFGWSRSQATTIFWLRT